ncbi:MAG: hypothetical protein LBL79_04425 [Prevotella sp.]|jgi:hypothetical protein|nr:hypothetical protein [Prevotella sp.]
MCNECEISEIYTHNGKFFDFALEYGSPTIIDYRYLDREIIVPIGGAVEIGDVKKKNEVKSVYELRSIFKELVWDVQQLLCQSLLKKYAPNIEETQLNQLRQDLNAYFKNYYCKDEDTEFLVNQLVFDILYSNYGEVDIHEEITLLEYCAKHFHYFSGDKWERYNQTEDLQTVSVGDKETAF